MGNYAISDGGTLFIANFEGFRSKPYRDAVGVWTIGFGHTHGVGPNTPPLSYNQALALLKKDLAIYGGAVNRDVKVALNQNQFDALTSFVYNLGTGILQGSTLLAKLNARDYNGAADCMLDYVHAGGKILPGLVTRRASERRLFLKPGPVARIAFSVSEARTLNLIMKERAKPSTRKRRGVIRRAKLQLLAYRASISAAALLTGWNKNDRRRRYDAILKVYNGATIKL